MLNELVLKKIQSQYALLEDFKRTGDKNLLIPIDKLTKELCLVYWDFRCSRCKSENELQQHHLITRHNRKIIDNDVLYIVIRHRWENVIILCNDCHKKIHNFSSGQSIKFNNEIVRNLSQEDINKIKIKYKYLGALIE